MNKPTLRAHARAARDAFFASSPAPIAAPAEFLEHLRAGLTVTSYVPLGSEADPVLLARAAVEAGCLIALPHVTTRSAPMRFLAWDAADDLHVGPMGLQQPHHEAPALAPDIILTPLLAFDAKLDRLGQGAGYYDRAFAEFPGALRIGVAWAVQQVDSLPVDAWDMPLHAVITESGWISRP
ncbi:5-formyltetrahydrofolate cyclo-ligase [Sphingomonas immobilis]|uniref:5-formyltetrahydrofolate cyclo-ligase n=1 Tax=Sphingomonas immobilis TaxID=3063997 RepID=A0ABT8ZY14_9SPHN|nr:5-formyltetrahydrofolate cyclo-ligase [Sphingomonas sp. CA1-15]MDO7842474.1 5-formyltetrahydrofolate cyclo-ligase [Sphingomonas sp. CA1-15]